MEWIELREIGKVSTGNTPPKKNLENYNENHIGLVKPSNFIENVIVNIESGEEYLSTVGKSKGRVAEIGNILVTCIGSIGNVGIVSKEVCFNQQINCIKADSSKIISKYLAYAISYVKPTLNHIANKAVVPIINKSNFEKIKIPVPPMNIQKQIVEVLDQAQSLIDKRKEQIKLLDDLIESIFYDMFGDPVKNDKGWTQVLLEDISINRDSERIPIKSSERINGKYPYYGASGIIQYVSDYIFDEPLLLISEDGANLLSRVTKIAFSVFGKVWVNNHAHVLSFEKMEDRLFVEHLLNLINLEPYITGTAQPKLNQKNLNRITILNPPTKLKQEFAEKVEQIESQKQLLEESLKLLEDNYNSLMQRAFKGELFN